MCHCLEGGMIVAQYFPPSVRQFKSLYMCLAILHFYFAGEKTELKRLKPSIVAHACNLSSGKEVEVGRSETQGHHPHNVPNLKAT